MRLEEYGRDICDLDPEDARFLAGLTLRSFGDSSAVITGLTPTDPGKFMVAAGPYLGRLGLPSGGRVDIVSRFSQVDPVELLTPGHNRPAVVPEQAAQLGTAPLLVDTIAAALISAVELLLRRGLVKSYVQRVHTALPYAGRLSPELHLRRFAGRPDRLVTVRNRLSVDAFENRILRRALTILSPLPLPAGIRTRLAALAPAFRGVADGHVSLGDMRGLRLTSVTQRYDSALKLAAVVASGLSLGPHAGQLEATSLLFYMPRAWESYVVHRVSQALPAHTVLPGHSFAVSDVGHSAVADAYVMRESLPVAVVDAKYKPMSEAPSSADIYQMATYCQRLSVDVAALIYPKAGPDRILNVGRTRIHILGLTTNAEESDPFQQRLVHAIGTKPQ